MHLDLLIAPLVCLVGAQTYWTPQQELYFNIDDGFVPCMYSYRRGEWSPGKDERVSPFMKCRDTCPGPANCANPQEMWRLIDLNCDFIPVNEYLARLSLQDGQEYGYFEGEPRYRPRYR